jgi:ABC-type amino acid transport substrate-binding protein
MKRASAALVVLFALATLLAASGCGQGETTAEDGPLRMMGNQNMAFLEVGDGAPSGFSADLAAEIADRLGRTLEITIKPLAELLPLLAAGECDIAMSAITITPERETQVDFSAPYFTSGQVILVRDDAPILKDSDLGGRSVGVVRGSTNQKAAEGMDQIGKIVTFDAKEPMFAALLDGKVAAVVCDTPFAKYNVLKTGKTRILDVISAGDEYGIALQKGDTELLKQINEALAAIRADGTYDRLYKQYFGG